MGDSTGKRKQDTASNGSGFKKQKKGHGGKWKTTHQQTKDAAQIKMGKSIDIGDQGLWVTYARGMKVKAVKEFTELCFQYGETMYGISEEEENTITDDKDEDEVEDIEASIQKELDDMKASQKPQLAVRLFTPITTNIDCVFFMKALSPIEPEKLALQICEDARDCADIRKRRCRYINRLTPVVASDKATDNGIIRVARKVLAPYFELNPAPDAGEEASEQVDKGASTGGDAPHTYAIRYNIRSHDTFTSEDVIKKIASVVNPKHKVNLGKPDKVILVEIFQLHCGLSVVDGNTWEALKKYNVNALYELKPPTSEDDTTKAQQVEDKL